jgi:4-amino-4-deoxy-L-arabinose transferase-like glycosyltransferase
MSHLRNRLACCWNWLADDRHVKIVLIGLLIISFVLRLCAVMVIPMDYRLRGDAITYISLAQQLLNREPYGLEPGVSDALVTPGYPLFVGGILALACHNLMAVRLAQVILGTIAVWLTYLIGKEAFSNRIGLVGASILAVYPIWVIWPALILTETLFTVFLLVFALYLVRAMRTCFSRYAIGGGFAFGLTLLTREVLYGFPLVLPLVLLWSRIHWRDAFRCVLLFSFALLMVLLPWLVRNYIAFGHVFYTDGAAYTRYLVTGTGYLPPSVQERLSDSPSSDRAVRRAELYGQTRDMVDISRLFSEPIAYLRQLFNRLVEFWLHPNGLESLPESLFIRGFYIAVHICLLALAGLGLVPELVRRDIAAGNLALLLVYITGTALFFGAPNPRYNLPFLPIVFIFAANGALRLAGGLVHGFRNRARRSAG